MRSISNASRVVPFAAARSPRFCISLGIVLVTKLKHATSVFLHRKFRTLEAATLARRERRRIDLVFIDVLGKQVLEVTAGAIPGKALSVSLSIGIAISVGLAMLRILTGLPLLWLIVPGYMIALVLSFFVPTIFTAIAFDSGGVASGAMTATFLMPLAMGLCTSVGGDVTQDAFGVVAMVAMTPLITIQLLGLLYVRGMSAVKKKENAI